MPNYVYIFDENNQYAWDTVVLGFDYYNGVYQMVERERFNDDETVIQERFEDGVLRSMSQFDDRGSDPDGVHDWTFIETVYDQNGQVEFRYSQYDDGRFVEENYLNGVLERHFQQDNSEFETGVNLYNWHWVETYYNQSGQIEFKITNFDDDTTREELFQNGALYEMRELDLDFYNPDGTMGYHTWHTKQTYFDPNGNVEFRVVDYDDGGRLEEAFYQGVIDHSVHMDGYGGPDGNGQHEWHRKEIYYDNGTIAFQTTEFDDGVLRECFFYEGMLERIEQYDYSYDPVEGSLHAWDRQTTYYDAQGQVQYQQILNDDQSSMETFYFDGQIERTVKMDGYDGPDGNGTYEWSRKEIFYENGTIAFQTTEFDDGVFRECFFYEGMLERIEQYDYSYDPVVGSLHAWDRQTTQYDFSGQLQYQYVVNDDQSTMETSYFDGQLERTFQTDSYGSDGMGTETWQSIETWYDPNGNLSSRHYDYDNGVQRDDHYYQGVHEFTFYQDGYGGAHAWDRVEIYYDPTGQIDVRSTWNDDGTFKEDRYVDGSISESRSFDNAQAHAWEEQAFLFQPNGVLDKKGNRWDDGDVDATIYNLDGSRELREVNHDGAEPWGARTTTYDAQGSVVDVMEFEDWTDAGPDYIPVDLFGYYYV